MPWKSGEDFAKKHNHAMHGEAASKAASIANAILKRTGDEGMAIAVANKRAQGRAEGGANKLPELSWGDWWAAHTLPLGGTYADISREDKVVGPASENRDWRGLSRFYGAARDPDIYAGHGMEGEAATIRRVPAEDGKLYDTLSKGSKVIDFLHGNASAGDVVVPNNFPQDVLDNRARGGHADAALHIAHRAPGGFTPPSPPYFERQEMRDLNQQPYGFTVGFGAGRHDKNQIDVGAGSYILPSDVVAGLGEGNSLAGAKVWDSILSSMPYGIAAPHIQGRHPPPAPPHDASLMQGITGPSQNQTFTEQRNTGTEPHFADGGDTRDVPIVSADGEVVISPADVLRIGAYYAPPREQNDPKAMMRRAHRILDAFVKQTRGATIKHLKSLPGPVGSKDAKKGHV